MTKEPCSDCGNLVAMTEATRRKGSSVREPGETLCLSCTASRSRLVREVDALPDTLAGLKAMRMSVGAA